MTEVDIKQATLEALFDLLLAHFNESELRDLCFKLGVIYEDLEGSTRKDKVRELLLAHDRRGQLPALTERLEQMRPHAALPHSVRKYIFSIKRLDRTEWLKAHGFEPDPFLPAAFKAGTDPLFELPGTPSFIAPPAIDELIGTPTTPGYRFIFAPKGGGKTSLRRFIFNKFTEDLLQWYPHKGRPLVLPIEYITHEYSLKDGAIEAHIRRIAQLIVQGGQHMLMDRAAHLTPPDFHLDLEQSLDNLIQDIDMSIRRWGLDGVCVLIDNLGRQLGSADEGWSFIQSIAARTTDLLAIDGLMFKFFCPTEFLHLAHSMLPNSYIYEIKWSSEQLRQVLEKRLEICISPQYRIIPAEKAFAGLFEQPDRIERIKEQFVDLGQSYDAPAMMWQLGHYLLQEHFESVSDQRQPIGALIRYELLDQALSRLTRTERYAIPPTLRISPPDEVPNDAGGTGANDASLQPDDRAVVALEKIVEILGNCCNDQDNSYNSLFPDSDISNAVVPQTGRNLDTILEKLTVVVDKLSGFVEKAVNRQVNTLPMNGKIQQVYELLSQDKMKEACEIVMELDIGAGTIFLNRWTRLRRDERAGKVNRDTISSDITTLIDKIHEWCTDYLKQYST